MDVGRLYWLAQATYGRHVDLDSDGYLQVLKAQKEDEETMSAFGVTDYTAFMKLHDELATCSRNLLDKPSWASTVKDLMWPMVFVAVCETRQLLAKYKPSVVMQCLNSEKDVEEKARAQLLHLTTSPGGQGGQCFTIDIVESLFPAAQQGSAGKVSISVRRNIMQLLCKRGICPKILWWQCPEVLHILETTKQTIQICQSS